MRSMETAKDRLEKVNFVYYYSVNADDLKDAAAELAALMQESWLSEDNMRRAEMLLWRVQTKRLALIYFEEGYDGSDADAAIGFAVQKAKLSEERGYKMTALVLSRVASLIERVNEIPKNPRAFCEKYATRENLDRAVDKIREIDVSACEEDVKAAKEEIVKSGEKLSETLAKMPKAAPDKNAALSALASSLLGGKSSGGSNFAEELGECLKQFNESAAKLAEIAANRLKK